MNTPCGSWRVVAIIEGHESEIRWCARVDGPCPFPGTIESTSEHPNVEGRPCAAEGDQ